MSIYYYFPSKSHLFDSLVDICIDETPNPDSDLPPRERLREFCLRIRETALRHPGFARFWLTHRLNHHHALGWLNRGVGVFEEAGLPTETAARVFRNVSYWVMGAALDETAGYSRGPSAAEPVPFDVAARDFPAIIRLGAYFGPENHDKTYLFGLEMLLDWFEAEVAAASARRKTA